MGGSSIDDEWEFASPSNGLRTLVLVGRTGNGKSATGNSILQKEAFVSEVGSAGVTSTCEMHGTVLKDGQILNIIDTPGLFDFSAETDEFVVKEISKCINMAKDGIHAVLLVLTVRSRFSKEEEAAVNSLRTLFGNMITDYMIVVFTGGDELEYSGKTLEDYVGRDCPEPLKEILHLCENRRLLFNNRANDHKKKDEQVRELLSLVNLILAKNGGKSYTDELFVELKKGAIKLHDQTEEVNSSEKCSKQEISVLSVLTEQMHIAFEEQLKRINETVELNLKEITSMLEKKLAEEQVARLNAEKMAEDAQRKSNNKIHKLRESLERAHKEAAERNKCAIL